MHKFSLKKFREFFLLPEAKVLYKFYFLNHALDRLKFVNELAKKEVCCFEASYRLEKNLFLANRGSGSAMSSYFLSTGYGPEAAL
jgi:hypothetical protein